MLLGGLGAGIGALYGIGDRERNYDQDIIDRNVSNRAAQGLMTGLGVYSGSKVLGPMLRGGSPIGALLGGLGSLYASDRIVSKDSKDPFYYL